MLKGNISLRNYYADMTIKLYSGKVSRALARAYYLKDDLVNAEKIYTELLTSDTTDQRIFAEMGLIYAKKGDTRKMELMIEKMKQF